MTTLPTATDMERCILSCMMQAPDFAISIAAERLTAASFTCSALAQIFQIILERADDTKPVDLPSILRVLQDRNLVEGMGGPALVTEVYTASPNPAHAAHYADAVADVAARRQAIIAAEALAAAAAEGGEGWRDACAQKMLDVELAATGAKANQLLDIKTVAGQYLDYFDRGVESIDPPVSTGIPKLDALLCGGIRREYTLIGGKSGHGKTLLAMQLAGRLAESGRAGLVVGYEMSALQMLMRDIAREEGIPLDEVMGRKMPSAVMAHRITRRLTDWIQKRRVMMLEDPRITPAQVAAYARRLKRRNALDFIVIDYLQLVPVKAASGQRRDEVLGELSSFFCRLRRELDCTLIVPVQLNDDGLIRDSRAIVHPAECFFRIEMDDCEDDGQTRDTGVIRVMKNRYGQADRKVAVRRDGARQTFTE